MNKGTHCLLIGGGEINARGCMRFFAPPLTHIRACTNVAVDVHSGEAANED